MAGSVQYIKYVKWYVELLLAWVVRLSSIGAASLSLSLDSAAGLAVCSLNASVLILGYEFEAIGVPSAVCADFMTV